MRPSIAPQTRVPDPREQHVQQFCESLVPGETPLLMTIETEAHAATDDCFNIVETKVASCGGAAVLGWAIWEWPGVLIEAEFHAVWRDESGTCHDISPTPIGVVSRLFLPDPQHSIRRKADE